MALLDMAKSAKKKTRPHWTSSFRQAAQPKQIRARRRAPARLPTTFLGPRERKSEGVGLLVLSSDLSRQGISYMTYISYVNCSCCFSDKSGTPFFAFFPRGRPWNRGAPGRSAGRPERPSARQGAAAATATSKEVGGGQVGSALMASLQMSCFCLGLLGYPH